MKIGYKIKKCLVCSKNYQPNSSKSKYCKNCKKIGRRNQARKRSKEYYWRRKNANPKRIFELRRKYRKNGDLKDPLRNRKRALRRIYGITLEDFNKILKKQNGVCAICQGLPQKKNYVVDHDHNCCATKKGEKTCGQCIRGLLCDRCNTALGRFHEDIRILQRAVNYLKKGYIK